MWHRQIMKATRSFIICATDFSAHANDAASVAAKLALRRAEKLLLVHATDAGTAKASASLNRRLESDALHLRESGADVEPILLHGARPTDALLEYVREQAPSLVVVGCGVKGPIDRWALGSFSEKIAEASPVPTLVVRNPAAFEAWDWMKSRLTILLALDFNASSDVVLRWGKKFQCLGPCDFIACHVNYRMPTMEEGTTATTSLRNPDALQDRLERDLRKKVRDQLGADSVPMVVRPNFGDAGPIVVEIAAEKKAHLIAVGAHQRHGIHRLAQVSVSREILHQAGVNVVCVPVTAKFEAREAHIPDFRRVLVATDFSELGNTAVPYACGACAIGGLVKIVHVTSPRESKRTATVTTSDLRLQLRELIPDETGARCQPPEVQVLKDNDVARALCDEAERFGADVVCLASHGLGASRALHGSVTKAVLKRIRRPLLVVRRPED
jgi:nucleotide-binding universal stress UspA family protein